MSSEYLLKQVSFIIEIDKLKYIQRKTKLFNSDRNENDAGENLMYPMKKYIKNGSNSIWEYAEKLINESVEKGILKK